MREKCDNGNIFMYVFKVSILSYRGTLKALRQQIETMSTISHDL
jgi:hypothetical protein